MLKNRIGLFYWESLWTCATFGITAFRYSLCGIFHPCIVYKFITLTVLQHIQLHLFQNVREYRLASINRPPSGHHGFLASVLRGTGGGETDRDSNIGKGDGFVQG